MNHLQTPNCQCGKYHDNPSEYHELRQLRMDNAAFLSICEKLMDYVNSPERGSIMWNDLVKQCERTIKQAKGESR